MASRAQPPRRSPPAAWQQAARTVPDTQPAAPASSPQPPPPPAPAPSPFAHEGYQQHVQRSDGWKFRAERQPQPQTETQLVLVWASILARGIPPQAATIWMRAVEPLPGYEFFITGDAVCGPDPDRALWQAIRQARRKPTVAERFIGRIRAPSETGQVVELGGGDLTLPPEPPTQSTPWATPQSPWGPAPGGYPGSPPYGYGGGAMGPYGPQIAAPPPPAAVQSDPAALAAWQTMAELNSKMMLELIGHAMKPAPVAAAAPPPDAFAMLERVLGITKLMRDQTEAAAPAAGGVTVLRVDEDSTLVLDKDGNVNNGATGWANIKHAKNIVNGIRSMRSGGPGAVVNGGGAQPPRRQTLPASSNGATKAGEKS
jgi:hypothetical protein